MATMLQLLKRTGLKAREASAINKFLEQNGVVTVADLENSPARFGTRLMGHDIYSLIHAVVQAANEPEPTAKKKKVKESENGESD